MRFVVTGATSFIGIEIVSCLLANGHDVIAVCRPNSVNISKLPLGVIILQAEMSEYSHLDLDCADVFIHLAWEGTNHKGRDIADIQKKNITNTANAIHVAKKMGCRLFVGAGSQAEYGITLEKQTENMECYPITEYGKAKLTVKEIGFELSEKLGIKYIHLRIFSVFGENDHPWTLIMSSIDKMLNNEPVILSPCTQNWNFLYVKDAACMIYGLCMKACDNIDFLHEVYNLASKETKVLKEYVERMKLLAKSSSVLKYGDLKVQNIVSLQPDMDKTSDDCCFENFHAFDDVIKKIIDKKKHD